MLFQGDGEEAHLRRRKQPREGVVVGNHLPLQVNWAGALEERSVMNAGDSLQEFDEGRAGQSWEGGHFQGWCRQWCRLDPLTLMVAWNGKAGKTVRRPPQAPGPPEGRRGIVKLSPTFPPEAGCLQLELPCAAWGLQCIQSGPSYRQRRSHLPFEAGDVMPILLEMKHVFVWG